jgi:hypothetical protein
MESKSARISHKTVRHAVQELEFRFHRPAAASFAASHFGPRRFDLGHFFRNGFGETISQLLELELEIAASIFVHIALTIKTMG